MPSFEVDPAVLNAACAIWDDQSERLQSSATRLSTAPSGGFTPEVLGDITEYLSSWSASVGSVAETTVAISSNLALGALGYTNSDESCRQMFEAWLADGL